MFRQSNVPSTFRKKASALSRGKSERGQDRELVFDFWFSVFGCWDRFDYCG